MKRVRLRITGHVQGVFFRDSAKRYADAQQLTGWVKNLPDGSLAAEVQGNNDAVRQFVDWCHMGPDSAQVDTVDVRATDLTAERTFEILG